MLEFLARNKGFETVFRLRDLGNRFGSGTSEVGKNKLPTSLNVSNNIMKIWILQQN